MATNRSVRLSIPEMQKRIDALLLETQKLLDSVNTVSYHDVNGKI